MKTFKEVWNLLFFFWKDPKKLAFSLLLAGIYTLTILFPILLHQHFKHLLWLTVWAIVVNLFHLLAKRVSVRLSNAKVNEIRSAMLNKIDSAGALENEQKSVAERLGNFNLLSDQLFYAGISIYGQLIYGVLFLVGVGLFSLYFFGLRLLLLIPALGIIWGVNYYLIKRIKKIHSKHHSDYVNLNQELVGLSVHYQPFKALGLLKLKLQQALERMKSFGKSEIAIQDLRDVNTFLNQSIIVLAFVYVAQNFKSGLSIGDVMIWTVVSFEVKKILIALFQANGYIYQGSIAFSKIFPELDFNPPPKDFPIEENWKAIVWENISFSYPNQPTAKYYPDFIIEKGDRLWIKGANGSGKTTLWKLVFGFYPPSTGKSFILPSHKPILPESISIGVVTEPVNLIPGKLWQVIGAYKHSKEEIENQIKYWGLEDYLAEIPDGLDHDLGNTSKQLSAGQLKVTQLLQALLRKPEVLILDEPFAAVDVNLCEKIVALLNNNKEIRSLIYISHQELDLSLNKVYQL
jgi:ABC-type multidrug transport system fused ATPase/permease subunit